MPEPAAPDLPAARARTRSRAAGAALLIAGITALAFNMRAAITSLPPLFPELATSLHLSSAALSVLASVPVLCFGVFSGAAAPLSRRFGEERVLGAALVTLAGGLVLRAAFPGALLYAGTALAAFAIALLNVLLPSLVKRRRPEQAGLLIGIYLLGLSAGSILASLIAVPVFRLSGGSVPLALGLWALPALGAALVWVPQLRYRTLPAGPPAAAGPPGAGQARARPRPLPVYRYLLTWSVTAFMGLQSLTFYATLSWLPTMFRQRGVSPGGAGGLLALTGFGGAVTALIIPVLAHRSRDQRALMAAAVAASVAGLAGAWFAPVGSAAAWTLILGCGQGACLGLAIFSTMARAPDPVTAASLSAFSQSGGYLVATAGPLAAGFLHAISGGWTVPVVVLLAINAVQLVVGWPAAQDSTLPRPELLAHPAAQVRQRRSGYAK